MKKPRKHKKPVDHVLLSKIEQYMGAHAMKPTAFGRKAANDPMLIKNLRNGRELRFDLRERVMTLLAEAAE